MVKLPLAEPVHRNPPSALELQQSKELLEHLRSVNLYESLDEAILRQEILGELDALVKRWVKLASLAVGLDPTAAEEQNAAIFTFGSYRLGVHGPGSDVDTLCVGPRHVTRQDHFFGAEPHCLERMLKERPEVTELLPVPGANVPVIKLTYRGVSFDLLYACLALSYIPPDLDLKDNLVLRGLEGDQATVRSLNGCRVTDTVLELVENKDSFHVALKLIKAWGDRRGITSNVSGYFGGINWAILTAHVCQLYPTASPATIVHRFFFTFLKHPWPLPLQICAIEADEALGLPMWDPIKHQQMVQYAKMGHIHPGMELMPIITPAYPCTNSSFNVNQATFEVLMEEFERGLKICTEILSPSAPRPAQWARLLEPFEFFEHYKHFIQVQVLASCEEDLLKWDGYVHSRLRTLTKDIHPYVKARPWPKAYSDPTPPPTPTPTSDPSAPKPDPDAAGTGDAVRSGGGCVKEEEAGASGAVSDAAAPAAPLRILYYIGVERRAEAVQAPQQTKKWSRTQAAQPAAVSGKQVNLSEPTDRFRESVMHSRFPRKAGMDVLVAPIKRAALPEYIRAGGKGQSKAADAALALVKVEETAEELAGVGAGGDREGASRDPSEAPGPAPAPGDAAGGARVAGAAGGAAAVGEKRGAEAAGVKEEEGEGAPPAKRAALEGNGAGDGFGGLGVGVSGAADAPGNTGGLPPGLGDTHGADGALDSFKPGTAAASGVGGAGAATIKVEEQRPIAFLGLPPVDDLPGF